MHPGVGKEGEGKERSDRLDWIYFDSWKFLLLQIARIVFLEGLCSSSLKFLEVPNSSSSYL